MTEVIFARQPIFDEHLNVIAYEILFRSNNKNNTVSHEGDSATSHVLLDLVSSVNFYDIVETNKAFINFTRTTLLNPIPQNFPKKNMVIEILEDIKIDDEVIKTVYQLKKQGYEIALDDFIYSKEFEPLIAIAKYIKIDVLNCHHEEQILKQIEPIKNFKGTLLAEKVETHEQFAICKKLNFKAFQGYFMCKPQIIEGQRIGIHKNTAIQIFSKLENPDISIIELERVIAQDAALTYKILRLNNSVMYRGMKPIQSLKEAIVRMGTTELKRWVNLMILSGIDTKPLEIKYLAIVRAKLCELIGKYLYPHIDSSKFFLVGLFSLIDVILHEKLNHILEQAGFSEDINQALLEKQKELGLILKLVEHYEKNEIYYIEPHISLEKFSEFYQKAIIWLNEIKVIVS